MNRDRQPGARPASHPPTELIREQLDRILASPGFIHSARMRQFLELVVESALSGGGPLKETVIGVEVFGRAPDYDSSAEPIVRVEARRLRQKLQEYYEGQGAGDEVLICLPKGGYTPEFEIRPVRPSESTADRSPDGAPAAESAPPGRPVGWSRPVWATAVGACVVVTAIAIWIVRDWRARDRSIQSATVSGTPIKSSLPSGGATTMWASQPFVSIAVLPMANLSGDAAQDYLADGMTDELIGSLAKISSLRVISRTSAMHYMGTRKTLPEIARELGVDAVVEGSVTRSGGHVRITAQLIDAKADRHLWSDTYLRPIGDMLAVEGEVARTITRQVRRTLSSEQESHLQQAAVPPEASDAYLKGRYFWNKRTEEGLRKSIVYFNEAVTTAPGYARAWAGLADSWLLLGETWLRPNDEAFAEAQKAVDKALALDDGLGEAHASRAALEANRGRWGRAEVEFRRALELSPGYATAHQWYAEGLAAHGRSREALEEIRQARALDPLSLTVNVQVGYILFLARRYDEAIAQLRATIEMDPSFWMAHTVLGHTYEQKRMYQEAIQELQTAVDLTNQSEGQRVWLAHAWALAGRQADARRVRAELEQSFNQGRVGPSLMALVDIALHEPDRALARLQRACLTHTAGNIGITPLFDPLRAEPRIAKLLARCDTGDLTLTPSRARPADATVQRRP